MSNAKNLVIVESPAKAKTIGRYLGDDYRITASVGHVRDLPSSTIGVDVQHDFKPRYITMRGKDKVVRELKKLAGESERVFIATDPDREGEAIAWHVATILKIDPASLCRVTFNEITEKAVKAAIGAPRSIDMDLVDAQQARRVLDRLVGYELSPVLWKKVKTGLSAGRVQSVATRMLVEREEAIERFEPEEYWHLNVLLETADQIAFKARYHGVLEASGKVSPRKLSVQADAERVIRESQAQPFAVHEVKKGNRKRQPYAPFTTSTLQQEAARRLNYSSKKTMSIAQQLYEGVDLPGIGPTALVTYIRTDSVRISEEATQQARRLIEKQYGPDYLPKSARRYQNKNAAQDAHEAIRPSHFNQTPEKIQASLNHDQFRLYKLIWDRFVASQMAPASINTVTVQAKSDVHVFKCSGEQIVFPGFLAAYGDIRTEPLDDGDENNAQLPELKAGQPLTCVRYDPQQKFTQPPPRYTEAALIKAMEEDGIGRPSTYAPTISTILDRHYAEKDKRQLVPTELGWVVTSLLRDYFDAYINVKFTAQMEDQLDTVESGERNWVDVMRLFYPGFHKLIVEADDKVERMTLAAKLTGELCPSCGSPLVIKDGRYGKFIACSNFPECKYTDNLVEKTGSHCPKCGSEVVTRKSRRGSLFYICDKKLNPDCDFISWDLPMDGQICPACGHYMVQKRFRGHLYQRCGDKNCPTNQRKKAESGEAAEAKKSGPVKRTAAKKSVVGKTAAVKNVAKKTAAARTGAQKTTAKKKAVPKAAGKTSGSRNRQAAAAAAEHDE